LHRHFSASRRQLLGGKPAKFGKEQDGDTVTEEQLATGDWRLVGSERKKQDGEDASENARVLRDDHAKPTLPIKVGHLSA
jgi:hypothetical protein